MFISWLSVTILFKITQRPSTDRLRGGARWAIVQPFVSDSSLVFLNLSMTVLSIGQGYTLSASSVK